MAPRDVGPLWEHGRVEADDWEKAGLYDEEAFGAPERRALLQYLTERGATLEEMVEAHTLENLPGVAGDLVLGPGAISVPVEDMAARCGIPAERVRRVFLAAGIPVGADDTVPLDLDVLITAFERGANLMGEDAILAFTRVLGAAATNVAEAAVALFYAEFGPGTGRAGSDEVARARLSEEATRAFAEVPEVLARLLLAQFARATRRAVLARGWSAGVDEHVEGGPGELVALGFVDLVGSTMWAEETSLRDQSLALSRFESAAWSSAVLTGGRVVKMLGDGAFFAAPTADLACRIGSEVCRAAAMDPILPAARGAIGFGAAIPREGDYFGPLVNLVSRLVKVAAPDELALTQEAAAALPRDRWAVRPSGMQRIPGLDHPVPVFVLSIAAPRAS
jgi:adenylate cyclase